MLARSSAFQYFVAAAPGAKELITIAKVWELAQLERWDRRNRTYDLVIVDAPASGHGLAMLTAPQTFGEIARVGPIRRQAFKVRDMLADPGRTGYVAVALPEEMPVNETLELEQRLEAPSARARRDRRQRPLPGALHRQGGRRAARRRGRRGRRPRGADRARARRGQRSHLRRLRREAEGEGLHAPVPVRRRDRAAEYGELARSWPGSCDRASRPGGSRQRASGCGGSRGAVLDRVAVIAAAVATAFAGPRLRSPPCAWAAAPARRPAGGIRRRPGGAPAALALGRRPDAWRSAAAR